MNIFVYSMTRGVIMPRKSYAHAAESSCVLFLSFIISHTCWSDLITPYLDPYTFVSPQVPHPGFLEVDLEARKQVTALGQCMHSS
jgi:hypothetical protein